MTGATVPNRDTQGKTQSGAVKMYGGTISLWFEAKGHRYSVADGRGTRQVASVTQILSVVDKSGPLTQWAANATVELLRDLLRPGVAYDEIQIAELLEQARFNFRSVSRKAKGVGALVHEWIEAHLRARLHGGAEPPAPVNQEAARACAGASQWIAAHFEPRAMEHYIYSRDHDYAGTIDVYGLVDGRPAIVDWKASSGLYPEFRLQTAAYAQAWSEMHDERVPDRWLVRLDKETGEIEPVLFSREEFRADLAAFNGAQALHAGLKKESRETRPSFSPAPASAVPAIAPSPAPRPGQYRYVADGRGGLRPLPVEADSGFAGIPAGNRADAPPTQSIRASANTSTPAGIPSAAAAAPRRRGAKRVYYLEQNGALELSGATFPIKDGLKAMGARVTRDASDKVTGWSIGAAKFNDVAGLCARAGIALAPAQQGAAA